MKLKKKAGSMMIEFHDRKSAPYILDRDLAVKILFGEHVISHIKVHRGARSNETASLKQKGFGNVNVLIMICFARFGQGSGNKRKRFRAF